ncbi:MAG: transposase [Bryobacterales bacterium]|nr:transposase [Bryobacterales bacterium]
MVCEYAELPWDPVERKAGEVLDEVRYLAIRVTRWQGGLFDDGALCKHYAVVTNRFDFDGKRLLEWHREKAGSIEALHHVLKNELAAGVMPCGRFGANAAWLRLAVMTHNVLTALKRVALKPEHLRARPKRLRFQIFCSPGALIHHARKLVVRVQRMTGQLAEWAEAWSALPAPG